MPAVLTIRSHSSLPPHSISSTYTRLGTDADCQFQLPTEAKINGFCLLEYDKHLDRYEIQNRSDRDLTLGRTPLRAGQKRVWNAGEDLKFAPKLIVRLTFEGSASPVAIQSIPQPVDDEQIAGASVTVGIQNYKNYAIAVGLVLLLICFIVLVVADPLNQPSAEERFVSQKPLEFQQLIETGLASNNAQIRDVVELFQHAHASQRRGQFGEARRLYDRLCSQVQVLLDESFLSGPDRIFAQKFYDLVSDRKRRSQRMTRTSF